MTDAPDQDEPLPTPASGPLPASPTGGASPAGSAPRLPSIEPFADGEPLSTLRCGRRPIPDRSASHRCRLDRDERLSLSSS